MLSRCFCLDLQRTTWVLMTPRNILLAFACQFVHRVTDAFRMFIACEVINL